MGRVPKQSPTTKQQQKHIPPTKCLYKQPFSSIKQMQVPLERCSVNSLRANNPSHNHCFKSCVLLTMRDPKKQTTYKYIWDLQAIDIVNRHDLSSCPPPCSGNYWRLFCTAWNTGGGKMFW